MQHYVDDITLKEYSVDEFSLEKLVSTITQKLEVNKECVPMVMYEKPFEFYLKAGGCEPVLKFSSKEFFEVCNQQDCSDCEEPIFTDIEDMMSSIEMEIGENPLEIVVSELKKNPQILACIYKF